MNIFDKLKELLGKHADKLPENMNSIDDLTSKLPENMNSIEDLKAKLPEDMNTVEEIKAKAGDLLEQHADVIDQVTAKIPGEVDDQIVDKVEEIVN